MFLNESVSYIGSVCQHGNIRHTGIYGGPPRAGLLAASSGEVVYWVRRGNKESIVAWEFTQSAGATYIKLLEFG